MLNKLDQIRVTVNDLQRILNLQKCIVTLPDLNFAAIKKPLALT